MCSPWPPTTCVVTPDMLPIRMVSLLRMPERQLWQVQKGILFLGNQEQYVIPRPGGGNLSEMLRRQHAPLVRIGLIRTSSPLPRLESRFILPAPTD